MKFNCVHVFTLEADSREEFDDRLARYRAKVKPASERLGIGYVHRGMHGNPAAAYPPAIETKQEPKELERLFDG